MKINTIKAIDCFEWDKLVQETYNKPYCFQQQDGCQSRGTVQITIPEGNIEDYDFENESIPEEVNGEDMGVKFSSWLARDPKQKLSTKGNKDNFSLDLFWIRNFYPNLQVLANDLHSKGLIEAGDYTIIIDW